eukprot:4193915-Pleurochrysis_carterae.AAC.1
MQALRLIADVLLLLSMRVRRSRRSRLTRSSSPRERARMRCTSSPKARWAGPSEARARPCLKSDARSCAVWCSRGGPLRARAFVNCWACHNVGRFPLSQLDA